MVLQNRLALDILTAAQGGTCAIIHTHCCTYIPDMSTNVTHFTKLVNKMIQAMGTPEASTVSLWEKLTSSSWWKTILIPRNLMVLFLLFAPWICNCVDGFISSCMNAFKLQMVAQTPVTATASSIYYLDPWIRDPQYEGQENVLPHQLGTMPLISSEAVMEREQCPLP